MKQKTKYSIALLILILTIAGIVLQQKWTDWGFDQIATIQILLPDDSIKIFIDDINVISNGSKGTESTFTVGVGRHSIIVAKDNFWPWQKNITLEKNQTATLNPFLIPKALAGNLIPATDPEYGKFVSLTRSIPLPTIFNKKISIDGKMAIWTDGPTIMAFWLDASSSLPQFICLDNGTCPNPTAVFTANSPIKNLDFYGSRNDLILFSDKNGVDALEMDKRGIQNFQPLYQGTDPYFYKDKDNFIYIKDGATLMQVAL